MEGIEIVIYFDSNSIKPTYKEFRNLYRSTFGNDPVFAGSVAYETMLILASALKETKGRAEGIREALGDVRNFDGLVGTISMDKFGDAIRTHFLHVVKAGRFMSLSSMEP